MQTDHYFVNEPKLTIDISHFEDDTKPWCTIRLHVGESKTTLYMTDEQIREIVRRFEIVTRVDDSVCSFPECTDHATSTVRCYFIGESVPRSNTLCAEHARLEALNTYRQGNVSIITVTPLHLETETRS